MNRPVVLVCARRTTRKNKFIDYVGELHLELLIRLRILPMIVPVVAGTPACLPQYMQRMDGLLLVEGDPTEDAAILQDRDRLLAIMKDGRFHKVPAARPDRIAAAAQ